MKEALFMEVGRDQHLVPLDPFTAELIDTKLKIGERYKITVVSDRSRGELNLYWAGISTLHHNLSDHDTLIFPSSTSISKMLLEALGHTHKEYFLDAKSDDGWGYRVLADSIAIDNMEPEEFKNYFELARGLVWKLWDRDPWQEWLDERPPSPKVNEWFKQLPMLSHG